MSIVLSSRAVTFVAALFAAACALAHGERGDPRDSLIIYSGFGYISEDAQPDLSALLFSSKPEFALPGDQLSESAAEAVSREFSQERLKRWSPHGVITSRGELDAILSRILGRTSGPEDRNKIFEMFDHVYALMFIGGLEYDAGQEASFAEAAADITQIKESWPIRHQYAITSTIAVLFDLKRNEIVASATQIGFEHAVGTNAELSQTSRVARLAKSYASGATGSAATLAGLLKKLTPQRDARDAGFERYSVTDAWIVQEANALTSLFGWKSAARPQNSICQRSMQCSEPGGNCEKLIGLMIHGMTASLSRAGFLTEPALHWSDWRASAAYQTTVTLSMGRVREQPIELRVLSMPPM